VKRGEAGHGLEPEGSNQLRKVSEQLGDTPMVGVKKRLEHKTGEQLRLCGDLRAELVRVPWQGSNGDSQRFARHPLWRLTGQPHTPLYVALADQPDERGFLQSISDPFEFPCIC